MHVRLVNEGLTARDDRRPRRKIAMLVTAVGGLTIIALTGLALASSRPTLETAKNSTIGATIAVDSRGLTVYELSPETTHHLLCTKANGCFQFWPPVKVASAKTKLKSPTGLKGKLGILHRNGIFQLTLAGHPLYHFSGDGSKKGMAAGQGLMTFGGRWHTVLAASGSHGTTTTTTSTQSTTMTAPTTTTTTTTSGTTTTPYYPPYPAY
jgi:predicted lipoprotein with Yx(FWY)xxD motif